MTQLTKQDVREVVTGVIKDAGVVTESNFGKLLKKYGVVTESNFGKLLKNHGVVTVRDLNKVKRELQTSIANVAVNSPTSGMFNDLEKRVDKLETAIN